MPDFFNQRNRFIRSVQWLNSGMFGLEFAALLGAPTNLSLGSYIASAFGLSETSR